jgi:hypothetical protein
MGHTLTSVSRSRPSLTRIRIVTTFGALLAVVITTGFTWSTLADAKGSDTVAEVVKVEHHGSKIFVTVRFTPSAGKPCESDVFFSSNGPAARIGERIPIHYPQGNACSNVRKGSEPTSWAPVVLTALVTIAIAVGAFLAWRPSIIPPPRYADMP